MQLKFENNVPIYLQIVEELKIEIISGTLKPGSKILSVRELSLKLKVNPNTLQKSLNELEILGLIYTERTNGKYVTEDIKLIKKYKDEYAKNMAVDFCNNMKKIGFETKDIIEYLGGMEK